MASIITGLQGDTLNGPASVLATAKHYLADGGTQGGTDQGDARVSESELRAVHLPPFEAAVERGVGSVMISFSSWNGTKLHGHRYLITDVLKGELGFDGFVVSDWNGIDQIDGAPGTSAQDVRTAVNAGVDMAMVPTEWRRFIELLRAEVQAGRVTTARVDDAVRRILTKKFELGLFEEPLTDRSYTSTVGSAAHRALAREAVAKSQVVLKNANDLLPLARTGGKIFVAGKSADDIGNQSGGWTISWQGSSGDITPRHHHPRGHQGHRRLRRHRHLQQGRQRHRRLLPGGRRGRGRDPVRRGAGRPARRPRPRLHRPQHARHPAGLRRAARRGARLGPAARHRRAAARLGRPGRRLAAGHRGAGSGGRAVRRRRAGREAAHDLDEQRVPAADQRR
ncbi:hypothetical protein GCM10020001_076710 [Nonomuraea salmonea]